MKLDSIWVTIFNNNSFDKLNKQIDLLERDLFKRSSKRNPSSFRKGSKNSGNSSG